MPTNYELQIELMEKALSALGGGQPHKAAEIKAWVKKTQPDKFAQLQASWGPYLSGATQDPNTRIERTPGQYTYSLRPEPKPSVAPASVESPPETVPADPRQKREHLVYPPLAAWLRSRGFAARVTAASKKGGVWGNPDVTGIKIVDGFLGQKSIETSTIEAKTSSYYWKYYFFEAVAHRRFANRAYFAFAHGTDEPSLAEIAEAQEMREYAEKYKVGVLVIFVPSATYRALTETNTTELALDLEELRIEELWPAVHEPVAPHSLNTFLTDVLGLKDDHEVYKFDKP